MPDNEDSARSRKTNNDRLIILEIKMDQAMEHMSKFAEETTASFAKVDVRLAKMDLNGRADKLRALADAGPSIIENNKRVEKILPSLEAIATVDAQKRIFNKELARKLRLNNAVVKGLIAALSGAIVYVFVANTFGPWISQHVHLFGP